MRNRELPSIVESKEFTPSLDDVLVRGYELEHLIEEEPGQLRAAVEITLERLQLDSGTTARDITRMDLGSAIKELDKVSLEAEMIKNGARQRAQGLFTRLQKYARSIAGATALFGAVSFTEGCAASGLRPLSRIEQKESIAKSKADAIKKEAITALLTNESLRRELSPELIDAYRQALEQFDEQTVNQTISELSDVRIGKIESEGIRSIRILSDQEIAAIPEWAIHEKKAKIFDARTKDDHIIVRAKSFVKDGKLDTNSFLHALVHEKCHVVTSDSQKGVNIWGDQSHPWRHELSVSSKMDEGVTELMTLRILEKMGQRQEWQAYHGGSIAAAYLLERIVGSKELATDYFEGKTDRIHKVLTAKFGEMAYAHIMKGRFGFAKQFFHMPEGLAATFDLIKYCSAAKIDYRSLFRDTEKEGMDEKYLISENEDNLVLVSEDGEAVGVVEDTSSLSPHSPPIRVYVWYPMGDPTRKYAFHDETDASKAKVIADSVAVAEKVYEQFYRDYGPNFQKDAQLNLEYEQAIRSAAFGSFHIALNRSAIQEGIFSELMVLKAQYHGVETPEQKRDIEEKIRKEVIRIGSDTISKLRAEVAKLRTGN